MCNLYNVRTNQEALREIARTMNDRIGNLEPSLDVYPDRPAPIVRNNAGERELAMVTWGMPSPPFVTKGDPNTGVTNTYYVSALAALARSGKSVPRAMDDVLRVGRHEAAEDEALVRHQRRAAARILRRHLDAVDRLPWISEEPTAGLA